MAKQTEIECGGVLDISEVAQWWEQAQAALQTGLPIRLKAEDLQRVDAAGLQAILCLCIAAQKHEIAIEWDNPSPVLYQAATLTGLNQMLRLA